MNRHPAGLGDLLRVLATTTPDKGLAQLEPLATLLNVKLKKAVPAKKRVPARDQTQALPASQGVSHTFAKPYPLLGIEQPVHRQQGKYLQLYSCYSAQDEATAERITSLLLEVSVNYQLLFWDDNKQKAGDQWLQNLDGEMDKADIGLLFLSLDTLSTHWPTALNVERLVIIRLDALDIKQLPHNIANTAYLTPDTSIGDMDEDELMAFIESVLRSIERIGDTLYQPVDLTRVDTLPESPLTPVEPHQPMLVDNLLRAFLSQHLSQQRATRHIDLPRLVHRASQKQSLFPLPRLQHHSFGQRFEVLIDTADVMSLYQRDIWQVVAGLSRLCIGENLSVYHCSGSPEYLQGFDDKPYCYPQSDTTVLIFSLLGFQSQGRYCDAGVLKRWQHFLTPLKRNGIKVCHMAPAPIGLLTADPVIGQLSWIEFLGWGNADIRPPAAPLSSQTPTTVITDQTDRVARNQFERILRLGNEVLMLAQFIAVTAHCAMPLLRRLKKQFAPHISYYAELMLLQSKTLRQAGSQHLLFSPVLADVLRQSFYQQDPGLMQAVVAFVMQYRQQTGAGELLCYEEAWLNHPYAQVFKYEEIEQQAQIIVKTMTESDSRKEGLAVWLNRVYPHLSGAVKQVASLSRGYALAGSITRRFPSSAGFIRAENRALDNDLFVAELLVMWAGDGLNLNVIQGLNDSGWHSAKRFKLMQSITNTSGLPLQLQQTSANGQAITRQVRLDLNVSNPLSVNGFSRQFPVSVTDQQGNCLWLAPVPDILFICAEKDWHYVERMIELLDRPQLNCLTILYGALKDSQLELIQLTDDNPRVVVVAFISQVMLQGGVYQPPVGNINNYHEVEFFLSTDTYSNDIQHYFKEQNIQPELDLDDKVIGSGYPLDNYELNEADSELTECVNAIKANIDMQSTKDDGKVAAALSEALQSREVLKGTVVDIRPDYESEVTNIIIDYQGSEVTVRQSEQGLQPIENLNDLRGKEVGFIVNARLDKGFDGSIRLAELQSPAAKQWFEQHYVGEVISGEIRDRVDDQSARVTAAGMPATLFDSDGKDDEQSWQDVIPHRFVIIQLYPDFGFIRLGHKQTSPDYQSQLSEFLAAQKTFEAEVINEHPEGVDLRFGEDLSGFLPNTEMLWGVDETSGWLIQTGVITEDVFEVMVANGGDYSGDSDSNSGDSNSGRNSHFPTLSLRRLSADTFKQRVDHLSEGQAVEADVIADDDSALYLIVDKDILAVLPTHLVPYRYSATPLLLNTAKRDGIEGLTIDTIDSSAQTISLSAIVSEQENYLQMMDRLKVGDTVTAAVVDTDEGNTYMVLTNQGKFYPFAYTEGVDSFEEGQQLTAVVKDFHQDLLVVELGQLKMRG